MARAARPYAPLTPCPRAIAPPPNRRAADDDDDDDDDDDRPSAGARKAYTDPAAKRAKAAAAAGGGKPAKGSKAAAGGMGSPAPPDPAVAAAKAAAAKEVAAARKRARAEGVSGQHVQLGGIGGAARGGSLRASTIKASVDASEERLRQQQQQQDPARKAAAASARKRAAPQLRRLTQEELLAEAKQTEIINRASLEAMLKMEEAKRVVPLSQRAPAGPRVRTLSKGGQTFVTFLEMDALPSALSAKAPPPAQPARCVVTGLPAKYRDPQTGAPYATLEAFRTIRGRGRSRSQSHGPAEAVALRAQLL